MLRHRHAAELESTALTGAAHASHTAGTRLPPLPQSPAERVMSARKAGLVKRKDCMAAVIGPSVLAVMNDKVHKDPIKMRLAQDANFKQYEIKPFKFGFPLRSRHAACQGHFSSHKWMTVRFVYFYERL